jgi:hypothetical protein
LLLLLLCFWRVARRAATYQYCTPSEYLAAVKKSAAAVAAGSNGTAGAVFNTVATTTTVTGTTTGTDTGNVNVTVFPVKPAGESFFPFNGWSGYFTSRCVW